MLKIIEIISIIIPILLSVGYITLIERKVLSQIQLRKGPNVIGIKGILQPLADGLKLFCKEIIFPNKVNKGIYIGFPIVGLCLALLSWLVIPYGDGKILGDLNLGILYILGISSISVYTIIMTGWSSNSKYSLFGSIRSLGQMISYEVCIGIIILSIIVFESNLNIYCILESQDFIWNFFYLFPICLIFFVCALAETNRSPFDLTEGESELVSGFNLEYGSMQFALLFIAEYAHILLMAFVIVILFFGGLSFFTFIFKLSFVVFLFLWIRASFPRIRYDQLMALAWKTYLPLSIGLFLFFNSILLFFHFLPS